MVWQEAEPVMEDKHAWCAAEEPQSRCEDGRGIAGCDVVHRAGVDISHPGRVMGIKFHCQGCDKKLHVKAYLAGKRGVCPYCGAKVRIPRGSEVLQEEKHPDHARGQAAGSQAQQASSSAAASQQQVATAPTAPRSQPRATRPPTGGTDPIDDAPESVWYVRPPSGGQYGPADGSIMRRWLDEGRVSGDSLVWREGWNEWKTADSVFRALQASVVPEVVPEAPLPQNDVPTDAFAFGNQRTSLRPAQGRVAGKSTVRNVAIVVTLTVICTALLVALFLVLQGKG